MNFKEELQNRVEHIETILQEYLPNEEGWQKSVIEAMNYSVLAGGKRLRPMLMEETYRLFGGQGKEIEPFMAAIEMIHTYSLVHDDLPAMDNDEYRRGRKTTHVVYGEAMAILAGDGLLNYAFETALKSFEMDGNAQSKAQALTVLARKAGIYGMIGGQTADIEAENLGDKVTQEHLMFIHAHKTSALIEASMMTGAILAGADPAEVSVVEEAAYNIGLAFQIQDDILDVTSTDQELGKPVHSDEKNNKVTYVTLFGVQEAAGQVEELSEKAITLLKSLNKNNEFLYLLVEKLINRRK